MNIEFEELGSIDKDRLGRFLSSIKSDIDSVRSLSETFSCAIGSIAGKETELSSHGLPISHIYQMRMDLERGYKAEMLELRDSIFKSIMDFFSDTQSQSRN